MFSPGSLFNIFRRKEKREGVQFSFTDHFKKLDKEMKEKDWGRKPIQPTPYNSKLRAPRAPEGSQDIHEIITDPRYGVIHENPEMAKKQSKKQLANMAKGLVPPGVKTLLRKFPRIKIG
tara:strand:+ start:1765 stop:2121 length:357 start_codon:yes stop_codon:yes gene_type:complete